MDKNQIRKIMKEYRDNLKNKEEMDEIIKTSLKSSEFYKSAKNIFIYVGFKSEINTISYINEFLEEGKKIFIPRTEVSTRNMEAVEIDSLSELSRSSYGILEPKKEKATIDKNKLDLIICPGLAFDKKGHRIGYGAGYYDKFMKDLSSKVLKAALCYDFQVLDKVPYEEHDIKLNYIVTEKRDIPIY